MKNLNRRKFIKNATLTSAGLAISGALAAAETGQNIPFSKGEYMGGFAAPKLDKVRIAMIGVGYRGTGHAKQLAAIDGTEIVAVSDLYEDLAKRTANNCQEVGKGERHQILPYTMAVKMLGIDVGRSKTQCGFCQY